MAARVFMITVPEFENITVGTDYIDLFLNCPLCKIDAEHVCLAELSQTNNDNSLDDYQHSNSDDTPTLSGRPLGKTGINEPIECLHVPIGDRLTIDYRMVQHNDARGHTTINVLASSRRRERSAMPLGPGIRVTHRVLNFNSPMRELEMGALQDLAYEIGQDWEPRMNNNDFFSTYTATVVFGSDLVIAYRLIPHTSSFDDTYDDIDFCGVLVA